MDKQLSIDQLTSKLCWLFAVVGMFRGDEIDCIDLSHEQFSINPQVAILPIALPKEKRRMGRICKFATIHAHANPSLCPVATLKEYLDRLPMGDDLVPHRKDPAVLVRPLIRDKCDLRKVVGPDTTNRHIGTITDLLERPRSAPRPRARAIGASAASKNGTPVNEIVVQASWSSSVMVDSF
ncbi:hypothetical protein BGZ99_000127 [Dissophora globulifera]|uniref:Uncharacterized protein n=1 Tax=Dissophora globulifera TaxID=979702 RepID=A0A9P6R3Z8_9FUNG|nr:hypothetical protein BGZ99_000127 [Dissophora globulifera]